MMATDPNSNGSSSSADGSVPPAPTPAIATMLTFANPPRTSTPADVATQCSQQGFTTVGITNVKPADVIDFSRFDQQSCIDLGDAIVLCVSSKGFSLPALGGTFDIMRVQGTQITFDNFTKAISQMMKPTVAK
jgi:hypothetical protein